MREPFTHRASGVHADFKRGGEYLTGSEVMKTAAIEAAARIQRRLDSMKGTRIAAWIVAGLVAGLVLGTVASSFAATPAVNRTTGTTATAPGAGLGLRLGASVRDAGGRMIDVVAKLTGLSAEDVQAKRAAGQSLEQIAASKDVSADKVVAQALAVRKQLLDEKVKAGTITQAQADAALAQMKTRLESRIANTAACTGQGAGGGCGGGGGCGMGGGRGMGAGGCGGGGCGATATQ